MNPLRAFYEGTARDDRGRSLEEILGFDDDSIEDVHDFIQWLFPLPEPSGANPSAPILDAATTASFRASPELRANLRRSLDRMLKFYGLTWLGARIVKSSSFPGPSDWLNTGNHNHLRLTRILRSLSILGEAQAARALFAMLAEIYHDERNSKHEQISEQAFTFWKSAIAG